MYLTQGPNPKPKSCVKRLVWRPALRFFLSLFREQSRAQLRIGFQKLFVRAHAYCQLPGELFKLRCLLHRNGTKIFQLRIQVWFHCRVVRGFLLWWRALLIAIISNSLKSSSLELDAKPGGVSNGEKVDGNRAIVDAVGPCRQSSDSAATGEKTSSPQRKGMKWQS